MKIWCAWHRQNFGCDLLIGEKDGGGVEGDTHGICPDCLEIELQKVDKLKESGFFDRLQSGKQLPVRGPLGPAHRLQPLFENQYPMGTSDPDPEPRD